ncbi:MAG: AAA family ATPase [Candidatus Dormibacteria bacterium]
MRVHEVNTNLTQAQGQHATLVGRDSERAVVEDLLDATKPGLRVLVIEGDAGIGKTTLWNHAVAVGGRLHDVHRASPAEAESSSPYSALTDLLSAALGSVPSLAARHAAALDIALLRGGQREASVSEREVAVAVLALMRQSDAPLLLAIDDAQWLDISSARILAYVLRRLDQCSVVLLLSQRPPGRDVVLGLERLRRDIPVTRTTLGPLALAAIQRILRVQLGWTPPAVLLSRLFRASGGNPFYALEIAEAFRCDGSDADALAPVRIPLTLQEAITARLRSAPPGVVQAVLVTFAMGRPTERSMHDALRLLGLSSKTLMMAIEAGVLERRRDAIVLTHPLLGSTAYVNLSTSERRDLHGSLATIVDDQIDRARHLALASEGHDAELAALLDSAASAARARGSPGSAAELGALAVAATHPSHGELVAERTLQVARDEYASGLVEPARARWRELAAERPGSPGRGEALWAMVEYHESRSIEESMALLDAALVEARDDADLAARVHASRGAMLLWAGHPEEAARPAAMGMQLADASGSRGTRARALCTGAAVAFYRAGREPAALAAQAMSLEDELRDEPLEILPRTWRATLMLWARDDLAAARSTLDGLRQLGHTRDDDNFLPFICGLQCQLECWAGQLAVALQDAEDALMWMQRSGAWHLRGFVSWARALVDAYAGDLDGSAALAAEALKLDEPRGVAVVTHRCRALLGFIALSREDPDAAIGWLEPLLSELIASGHKEPSLFTFLPDLVEAQVRCGDLEAARDTLAPFLQSARALGRPWGVAASLRSEALILMGMRQGDRAASLLRESVRLFDDMGEPFEAARSLIELGVVRRRSHQRAAAGAVLQDAVSRLERIGTRSWCDRAARELRRVGLHSGALGTLTGTEERIARLVAEGRSNREIASLTFLSEKSVEAGLTRLYRKLGVRSRTQLAVWMSRRQPEDTAVEN